VPAIALPIYAAALTRIMVEPLAKPVDFAGLLAGDRFSAFLIGPGAGASEDTRIRVLEILKTGRPTLLDADAITAFRDDPPALDRAIVGPCVLTPHDAEFRRPVRPNRRQAYPHARGGTPEWRHHCPERR
jgi:ADP-dependent NAD(P)H-hydrate dehydratase / NAD(P)H-hydrate epimerase